MANTKINLTIKLFLSVVILSQLTFAQRFNFETYNTRDGLSQSQIVFVTQDDDGYMWFATRDGINRFNGRDFTIFNRDKGLTGTDVTTGLKDKNGNIWFGFLNGTISIFNRTKQKFEPFHFPVSEERLCSILKIFEDNEGIVWIATYGCGLFVFNKDTTLHITTRQGLQSNDIIKICQTDSNQISIIDTTGFHVYDRSMLLQGIVEESGIQMDPTIAPEKIDNCFIYPDFKQAWFTIFEEGAYLVDLRTGKIIEHLNENTGLVNDIITEIYVDHSDNVWFVYQYGNVTKYNPKYTRKDAALWTPEKTTGLTEKRITTVFQDREENYWLGTDGGGVIKYRDDSILLLGLKEGLSGNSVWAILKTSTADLWIGTNKGLTRIYKSKGKTKTQNFDSFITSEYKYITSLYEDKKGDVWFYVADIGMYKWHKKNGRITKVEFPERFDDIISQVIEDSEGNYWFISVNKYGLLKYDIKSRSYQKLTSESDGLLSNRFRFIHKDKQGDLWFSTELHGLMRLQGNKWTKYSKEKGCPIYTAISMTEDEDGNYWFTTVQNQLYKFDGHKFFKITTNRGLHSSGLYSVIADGNTIWVGTTQGIARFNPTDSSFIQYGYKEGYPINETNERAVFRDDDGYMWFGTIEGAVAFNPHRIKKNLVAPKIQISSLQVFYKNYPFPANHQFATEKNHLTFYFQALSFTKPKLVRYRYKLEGFDTEWSPPTDIPKATYSNLPPGDYQFKVVASNGEEVWTERAAQYNFTILTPFWMTWWFIALSLILISLIIVIIVKIRIFAIEKQRKFLEQKVRERTNELLKEKEEAEKAMKALHESETKFRSYTQLASSAIYIHQDDRFKFVNKAGEAISGYSLEELRQMNIWKLLHPDDLDMVLGYFKARLAGEQVPERYEFRMITKQKEIKWLDFSGRIIEFEGKPAVLATVFDITERKTAEKALTEEKERLAVTLSSIGDGVITTAINGEITIFNNMAEKVTGWSEKEARGKLVGEVFKVYQTERSNSTIDPLAELQADHSSPLEDRVVYLEPRNGDKRKVINYSVVPLRDQSSEMVGAVIAFRDITEKKQMEEELFKAQKLESIGLLAGGIAHDFNNIMTAIMGNISLAKMHQDSSSKVIDLLDKAEKATSRAQDLTQQLLTFSKGGTPVLKTSSVESVIEESVDFVLKGSNVKCVLDIKDDIKAVEIDEGQISQVIQNLVINADQAMPEGGTITISVKNVQVRKNQSLPLTPGEYVRIDVKDDGIGIKKEYLDKIFDPFFSTKQTGSGLGLATSYSILQKHNGFIFVQSEIGKGSVFSIFLPASAKRKKKVQSETVDSSQFVGKGRILIMDDDGMVLETSRALLGHLGFEVDFAKDGKTALEKYRQLFNNNHRYDLVIMDLTIPGGMGGKRTIEKLLQIDPEALAIVSSGYSTDPIMANFKEYGFKGRLKKPFNVHELLEVLENLGLIHLKK